jgi:hypothetical protein
MSIIRGANDRIARTNDNVIILRTPAERHVSAPARSAHKSSKVSTVTPSTFNSAASRTIAGHRLGGMPRLIQLLTTGGSVSSARATTLVPPSAVISVMSESIMMNPEYFTKREVVNIHVLDAETRPQPCANNGMATPFKDIGNRLVLARDAMGIRQVDVCAAIKVKTNRYSQYESGERRITLPVAMKLAEVYGWSLDWIYRNDPSNLPVALHKKISRAA